MKTADQQILRMLDEIKAAQAGGGGVTEEEAQAIADAKVSDAAYDQAQWAADTTHSPSRKAIGDKIEAVVASIPAGGRVIGTATFEPAGDPVSNLVVTGIVTGVIYNNMGNYSVTGAGILTTDIPIVSMGLVPTDSFPIIGARSFTDDVEISARKALIVAADITSEFPIDPAFVTLVVVRP